MEFCENCGSKVSNDDKFCQSCGASLQHGEQQSSSEVAAQAQQISEVEPMNNVVTKKKKRWPIVVASLIFVFILGGIGWAFLGSNNAKTDYLKAESNTMKLAYKEWSDVYGDGFALADKLSKESYQQTLNLSASVSGDSIPDVALVQAILESMNLQLMTKQDVKNEQHEVSFNFMMNNDSLADFSMYQSNDKTAVKLPLLNEPTYYFIENEKFGEFVKELDPTYNGPDNIKDILDFKEQLNTGLEAEYKDWFKGYGTFLFDQLAEKSFSKEKNVQYQGNNADKITLTLTDGEIKTLLTNLLDKIENDEKLIDLIIKQNQVALLEQTEEEYRQELKDGLKEGTAEIKSGLEDVSFGDGLVSTIYVNGDNLIVGRDVSIAISEQGDDKPVKISYVADTIEADDLQIERKLTIKSPEGSDEGELAFNWNTKKKKNDAGTDVNTVMKLVFTQYGSESVNLVLNMDTVQKANEAVTDFTVETNGDLLDGEEIAISGQLAQKIDQDLSKNYANSEMKFSLTVGMDGLISGNGYEEITIHLNADTKTDFTNNLEFPDLQSNGAKNVSEMSEDEWFMIMEEISSNFEQLMYGALGLDF
ncbi:MAG TPA: zinc-ribbon domain-containing protein [Bacilli bacterium]|nr:zinc-ribbon domain-containing protein [Bacilli bacterium]